MRVRTIVFLSHTIYVEGVVNRLQQHFHSEDVHFIDPDQSDYIEKVSELSPSIVVVDAEREKDNQLCTMCNLLSAFPTITIIRLKAQEKDVQVISSSSAAPPIFTPREIVHKAGGHGAVR